MSDTQPQPLSDEDQKTFITHALKTLRTLCRGNGVRKDAITYKDGHIALYEIAAQTIFQISPDITLKTVTGKQNGDVCENQGDMESRANQYIARVANSAELSENLYELLCARPDKGAGIEQSENIAITNYNRSYIVHEGCGYCKTKGQILCQKCDGHRMQRCQHCDGITRVHCTYCHGSGRTKNNNQEQSCYHCDATGQMQCRYCRATGKISCRGCAGKGQISCTQCSASGWFSHMADVSLHANATFTCNTADLPQKLGALLNQNISGYVRGKDIKAITNDRITALEDNKLCLDYVLRIPYGELNFSLKKMALSFGSFGFQHRLVNVPDFLDRLIKRGTDTLQKASSGQGNVTALLQKCSRYRIIGLSLLEASRGSRKRARKVVKSKYPMALSGQKIEKIVHWADRSLSKLTLKPRYKGLAIGASISAICFGGIYLTPMRMAASRALSNANIDPVLDLLCLAASVGITTLCAQLMAKQALSQALGHLLPLEKRKTMTPKAGRALYFAIAIGVTLLIFVLELSIHVTGQSAPWYINLRS